MPVDWKANTVRGHLEGVCTVVDRLFRIIGDCRAYFGEKDYQQLLVVHDLAARLGYPQVIGCATVRDSQGLALSSRNKLLTTEQIKSALNLFGALRDAQNAWSHGERSALALKRVMHSRLDQPGIKVDYAEVRDPEQWFADPLAGNLQRAVALVASLYRRGETHRQPEAQQMLIDRLVFGCASAVGQRRGPCGVRALCHQPSVRPVENDTGRKPSPLTMLALSPVARTTNKPRRSACTAASDSLLTYATAPYTRLAR